MTATLLRGPVAMYGKQPLGFDRTLRKGETFTGFSIVN